MGKKGKTKKVKVKPTINGKLMFPSEYIVAEDLKGRDVTLTIARVRIEMRPTDSGPQPMPFLYFEEMDRKSSDKRLGLNVTNARSIARLYGTEATDWIGERITIYPTTCDAFGDIVTCVRIRDRKPGAAEQKPPSQPANEPETEEPPEEPEDPAASGELTADQERDLFGG
jgi:hypothetical protein